MIAPYVESGVDWSLAPLGWGSPGWQALTLLSHDCPLGSAWMIVCILRLERVLPEPLVSPI